MQHFLILAQDTPPAVPAEMPSLWDLAVQGGWFMIPIAVASVVTIAFTLERLYGLQKRRILPGSLIQKLRTLMNEGRVEPQDLWETCEQHPSPLASVTKAAVLKTGRTQPEVEKAVQEAVDREVGNMTRSLRPINVVASIAPLLGLLGTVQGMIMAFMVTSTTSSTGTAKAQELAHGIYTALVTTFAGLSVAVVSVVLANYLEGRIEKLLRQMEVMFLDLLPQLEKFEGRLRVSESVPDEATGATTLQIHSTTTQSSSAKKVPSTSPPERRKAAASSEAVAGATNKKVRVVRKPRSTQKPALDEPEPPGRDAGTLRANFER